jgi:hypothetical protein
MSRRPAVDLSALTSEAAAPMSEASQRVARPVVVPAAPPPVVQPAEAPTKTANLQALAFKGLAGLSQTLPPARGRC